MYNAQCLGVKAGGAAPQTMNYTHKSLEQVKLVTNAFAVSACGTSYNLVAARVVAVEQNLLLVKGSHEFIVDVVRAAAASNADINKCSPF